MTMFKKWVRRGNKDNDEKEPEYVSIFSFITFHWVTKLLNNLIKDEIKFPTLRKNDSVTHYASELEQNLRKIYVRKCSSKHFYEKSSFVVGHCHNSKDIKAKKEYNVYYNNLVWTIFKTFKVRIISIIIFNVLQTLFIIAVGGSIDKYMLILKGETIPSFPAFLNNSKVIFGLYIVGLLLFEFLFDSILNFYYYEFLVNMEISLIHFLYKINLYSRNNDLTNHSVYRNREESLNMPLGVMERKSCNSVKKNPSCMTKICRKNDSDNLFKKKFYLINFFKKNRTKKEEDMGEEDTSSINIYNIMFSDTPSLVLFVGAVISLSNIFVKFYLSFYVFYLRMGSNAVKTGASLSVVLYSTMILFSFLPSLFKSKYLKYRDQRIDNTHHVLKEFKLMKMFNWESFAFNYINFVRKKEMLFCKVRLYLATVGIFISAVSADIVEVLLFFLFIREKLDSQKEVNFSSIIMPLFVYKSLISSASNFPNLMNNIIEGTVNIARINKYVNHHLYYNDINNYFRYVSKMNNYFNASDDGECFEKEGEHCSRYRKHFIQLKNRLIKCCRFSRFYRKGKHINIINRNILSGVNYSTDNDVEKVCFQTRVDCSNGGSSSSIHEKNNNKDDNVTEERSNLIIKLENAFFGTKRHDRRYEKYILKNINFSLENNTLAIVIGNVGSGKTAFFESILGDIQLIHGFLYVKNVLYNMPILYVPQNSWLSIGNIRSMILFGNEYNSGIYRYTVEQSELLNDISSFKNGDMRYVNDDHNLSKGQKVRISLARALYHHYMHLHKLSSNGEKKMRVDDSFANKNSRTDFSNGKEDKISAFCQGVVPFDGDHVQKCLRGKSDFSLYLLDDIFTSLDPAISKNIFYNLFCKEENKSFKDYCSFVVSMNENTFHNFFINDLFENIQYKVDIYELENYTLKYAGSVSDYVKSKNIKKDGAVSRTESSMGGTKFELGGEEGEEPEKCGSQIKGANEGGSSKRNNTRSAGSDEGRTAGRKPFLENDYIINAGKNINGCADQMAQERTCATGLDNQRHAILSQTLQHRSSCANVSPAKDDEDESFFKGNIELTTYRWFLSKVGGVLILYIMIFMFISIFTDEIKFFILSMISIISRNDKEHSNEILQHQIKYLKLFVILPIISLIASFFCFMFIIYGTVISAVKVHTDVLKSILSVPMYVYYNNNLGNIINRFVTDIYSLDNGFLKRFYKFIFLFFRLLMSIILLFCMVKDAVIVFPFIVFLIYSLVFKKFSRGCKEAQRGYLRCHSPLCNIYSNTISGKSVINVYEKNWYHLGIYERYVETFRNYCLLKWAITIWASFYIRLIFLILTSYFIMHPHIFFNKMGNLYQGGNYEKIIGTIGYCITFSSRLGVLTKILLCDYTYVEKEMCCVQRLEEFSKLPHEKDCLEEERGEVTPKCDEMEMKGKFDNSGESTSPLPTGIVDPPAIDQSKEKYGVYLENVFVSYKKKVVLDKNSNKYCYTDEDPSLKNITIYALKNQKIGIVGKSGSGKSTIILSILGLIPTVSGKITVEGRDIGTLPRREKNDIITVLPQSSFVFHNWNVRTFIDPYRNFTDEEIVNAFDLIGIKLNMNDLHKYIHQQRENAHDEREKKKKGKRKANLSSNTISLTDDCIRYLSIVRLFLNRNKYKLILIDEIPIFNFNSVDSNLNNFLIGNAKPFNYIIKNYFPDNTILIISHDTHALSCCDFIYVLRRGEVAHRCSCKDVKTQSELAQLLERDG
ncbi:ABC transporter, putative [Plasmodium vivax]|uniref:ABC transporter, putative n=1 Tax=Plasmodium vivax TaxID=5855 RepID=A0A1G4H6P9_PLAVI|nr:ABC transporter, putative [Plasmodium vivax]